MYRGDDALLQAPTYDVRATDAPRNALLDAGAGAWATAMTVEWGPSAYRTAFRALWRDDALVARFDVRDERPWHTMRHRDACLWEEEVVEIFLDPTCSGTDYIELEISPANVVCDLHIAQLAPARDVRLEWNFSSLDTIVCPGDRPDDWTAIACMPFADLASLSPRVAACLPVTSGDAWHFNVFRIKRPHGPSDPERDAIYAAWSVPDGVSFHTPEAFRPLRFMGV
jgi:hypothetical protein